VKIAFDHQIFASQSYGGISRYFTRLAHELASVGDDVNVVAPVHKNKYLLDLPKNNVLGKYFNRFPPKTHRIIGLLNQHLSSIKLSGDALDVFHETYYSKNPVACKTKARIITVYDMIHERFQQHFSPKDQTTKQKKDAIKRADHVISISESTKQDLCCLFDVDPCKVTVVHLGFDDVTQTHINKHATTTVEKPFLLYVGNRYGYKNFNSMLKAIAASKIIKNEFDVIAFGGGAFSSAEKKLIHSLEFKAGTVRQISGDDSILWGFYQNAAAFIYPSLYEGFGIPPLEAMVHDCPVISGNTSSMPEVIGGAGEFFNPYDIDDQVNAIQNVVFSSERRKQLIAAGRERLKLFSWSRCASETRNVYLSALQNGGSN